MKKMFILLVTFLYVSQSYAKVNVVVSILPQQTFVEKIGGDKVNVTTMVKPGNDPHTYEPKPSQMIAISKAQIYFPIKIEFENAWLNKFKDQNKKMQFIETTKGIEYIKMPEHGNHEEDGHEEELPFEWAGVFNLKKGNYTWSFSKVNKKYADPKMKFLMIKAENKSDDLIESYEDEAKEIFESNNTIVSKNNDTINANKKAYELHFSEDKNQTVFTVSIKEQGNYIFFTEHMPSEFEGKEHFFKDLAKNDIEAMATHPESNGHHHHHHHDDFDPHTWVSPSNVKIMAKEIFNALAKVDSKNRSFYKKNYEKFLKEIDHTDKKIKSILSKIPKNSKFMVFHPSWGYFAKEYSLVQLPIEVEGKEPKPKMLQKIIEKAKKERVKVIFAQQEFSDKSAKMIATELNIKVIKETPLSKDWSENLIRMANAIANNN